MHDFFDYVSKAHYYPLGPVWCVQAHPEPEPDLLEPELMVKFRVQENHLNQTDGLVSDSA
jgi:hypothetical protein